MLKYIITAPKFEEECGGSKALYKLCGELLKKGLVAYITLWNGAELYNSESRTAYGAEIIKTEAAVKLCEEGAVAVYPEIVILNPLRARKVVRWYLNTRDQLARYSSGAIKELRFAYTPPFEGNDEIDGYLFIDFIEVDLFNNLENRERKGKVLFLGKGNNNNIEMINKYAPQFSGMKEIRKLPRVPDTREELADWFKTSEELWCFDDTTAVFIESVLCGCPAVVLSSRITEEHFRKSLRQNYGLAWGFEQLEKAKQEVNLAYPNFLKLKEEQDKQLDKFIELTQSL